MIAATEPMPSYTSLAEKGDSIVVLVGKLSFDFYYYYYYLFIYN